MKGLLNTFGKPLLITVLIETVTGFIFGVRKQKEYLLIVLANIMTNVTVNYINLLLFKIIDNSGRVILYTVLEILVVLTEFIIYRRDLKSVKHPFLYSLAANTASFAGGIIWKRFI